MKVTFKDIKFGSEWHSCVLIGNFGAYSYNNGSIHKNGCIINEYDNAKGEEEVKNSMRGLNKELKQEIRDFLFID